MNARGAALSGLVLSLLATPAIAGPSMNTRWMATTLEQSACVERAKGILATAGFTGLQSSSQSAFAQQGEYSVVIRCIAEKTLVFFVVAGPVAEECRRLTAVVSERF